MGPGLRRDGGELWQQGALARGRNPYSSFFDIRSRRSCMSFICWRRSSILLSFGASAVGSGAGSAEPAGGPAPGAEGFKNEKGWWDSPIFRGTRFSRGAKGGPGREGGGF